MGGKSQAAIERREAKKGCREHVPCWGLGQSPKKGDIAMNIMERLAQRISELKNPTVAGLDTRIEYLPEKFVQAVLPDGIHSFEDAAKAVYA